MVARSGGKWQFPACERGEIVKVAGSETRMTNLRFAAVVPWCREAAVPVLVLACIVTSGYAPNAGARRPAADSSAQAPAAEVKINDVKIEESKLSVPKPDDLNVSAANDTDKQLVDKQQVTQPTTVTSLLSAHRSRKFRIWRWPQQRPTQYRFRPKRPLRPRRTRLLRLH